MKGLRYITLLTLLLLPVVAFGADTTGRINGVILDEQGAPLPGATVVLSSPAMQGTRTAVTDVNGRYLFALLPPGQYAVAADAPGQKSARYNVTVLVGQTVPLDITLKAGQTEEVTVLGNVTKMETTAGGENLNYKRQINELPVPQRDITTVANLAPNVSFGPTAGTLSISGAPSFDTTVLLDGAEVSDPYFGSAPDLYLEEAVEEVQVLTSGVSARYGRFQGGIINATTKSGGNEFSGVARVDLFKQSWGSLTPYNDFRRSINASTAGDERLSDDLQKTYSATVGGFILKDRLWFFLGGRKIPTSTTNGSFVSLGEGGGSFPTEADEERFQIKLKGAVNANHSLEASYLSYDRTTSNRAGLPAAEALALGDRADPRETQTFAYQGILSDSLFLDFQGTRKRVSIKSGGDPTGGSPFLDFYGPNYRIWNNHWWDYSDASVRDNDTLSLNLTQALSSAKWGDHTLEYGVQYVKSLTGGENRQSPTGYNLLNYDALFGDNLFVDPDQEADPRFDLLSLDDGGVTYRWVALPLGGEQELQNLAAYVSDSWQIGKWRVDAGLRWEQYEGTAPPGVPLDLKFDDWAPRLGVTYNIDTDWQVQATYGKYISRLNDNVINFVTGVSSAPYIQTLYTGPTREDLTRTEMEELIRNEENWGIVMKVTDPRQPTRGVAPDLNTPYAWDLNFSVKRALPRNTGTVTLTYTQRDFEDLLDDYVGDLGTVDVNDPGTGEPLATVDFGEWRNSQEAFRRYRALTFTANWRPTAKWGIGGNYVYSFTEGNYEGEGQNQPSSGSVIGNHPRLVSTNAYPFGYLSSDIRHRVRMWSDYRFDFGRAGSLTLGSILFYRSGSAWSKTAGVTIPVENQIASGYATPPSSWTAFVGPRGGERNHGFWNLDLSVKYQLPIWQKADLDAWIKLDATNVTNNDAQIAKNTSGVGVPNGYWVDPTTGELILSGRADNPATPDVREDLVASSYRDWRPSSSFGRPTGAASYQQARRFYVSLGISF